MSGCRKIQLLCASGKYHLGQIAVLYRMRNVSSVFEKRLKEYVPLLLLVMMVEVGKALS